jgi:ATP synthase subunit 6
MRIISDFLLFSPLEQFEISSFNNSLSYTSTFGLENLENKFFSNIIYTNIYNIFNLIFLLSFVLILQTNIKQKGFLFLFVFIYILTVGFNWISFTDFLVNKIHFEKVENSYINLVSDSFEYVTVISSSINIYSVFFCFVFAYIVIYLIYNKMLSNNSNTLIPNLYQILAENLYKVSLNLFYSILGKHITIPEFFIKINTIFIFLIISNVQGMIPYMSTLTSALTNTFFIALALFISIITTLLDKKGINYFLNLFMPSGCPILLSLLIIPIEVISYSFRLVSLSVRLFANMMAGHTLLKVIVGFSWVIVFLGNTFIINLFPILILFILTLLEFGVALIQAYIFTVLSCIYLRDIFEGH